MKDLKVKLDEIERQYGVAVFKEMYRELVENLSILENIEGEKLMERIEDDLNIMTFTAK